jgi:adhesin/invasin
VNPLFAGRPYSLFGFSSITDLAGNRLIVPGLAPNFTTALAPGTANLPTGATVVANPASLTASGTISSTIVITNITRGGAPVPNGTIVGITAQQAFAGSVGGTISGASVGASPDGRFLLFSTLGAAVTVSYTPPSLMSLGPNENATGTVQVVSVDLDNRPSTLIGQVGVTLSGIQSVTMVVSPLTLPANGTSTATITATFKDKNGNIVPDGTVVGLTAAPIFTASAGGTILGGTTSTGDTRIQLFTTTGVQISATYRSPTSKGSGQAVIQAVTVNGTGNAMKVIGPTTTITLQ